MTSRYKAIIFDFGNVVFKIHIDECFQSWATCSGRSFESIKSKWKFDEVYEAHERSEILASNYMDHVNQMLSCRFSFVDFERGCNSIYGDVNPETEYFLKNTKGLRFFGFTNSNILHRDVWTKKYADQIQLFEKVFCSSQIKLRKPEPRAFEFILREIGLKKEEVLFVDDLSENVKGAEKFGIRSILFANPTESIREIQKIIHE